MAPALPVPLQRAVGVHHRGTVVAMTLTVAKPLLPPGREHARWPILAMEAAALVAPLHHAVGAQGADGLVRWRVAHPFYS